MVDDRNGMNGWGMNPRKARGGIKAQSEHGTFGKHWWARRWISAMEQLVSGPRLIRGQFYARQGQVVSIEETRDGVAALVQGSRPPTVQGDHPAHPIDCTPMEPRVGCARRSGNICRPASGR